MADVVKELELKVNAEASKANDSIDRLVGKLDRLTTSLSKVQGTNLSGLGNGVQRLGTAMQSMNAIKTADFTRLATNLSRLGKVDTASLNSAASSMSHLTRAFNTLGGVSQNAIQVGELAKNISKLGNKSVQTAITNIPRLATSLNGLMTTLSKSPQVSQNVIQLTNAMANLSAQGSKIGSASTAVASGLNKTTTSADKTSKSFKGLAYSFGKFYANCFLLIRGLKALWKSMESSMDYIETLNYFDSAFEQVIENVDLTKFEDAGYDSAKAYADSFSETAKVLTSKMSGFNINADGTLTDSGQLSLGIDPERVLNYQAMFAQMSSSMGVASGTAVKLSNALTMIGADLASVKNLDFDKVWEDMASGLAGMSRTLDKYGVNIRNVNLQQKLFDLGIQANIQNLNQNEKALLRATILLDSTHYAWGDLADTLNMPANQLRLLTANFQNLSRTIGNLFIPVLQRVLPVVNGVVIALQRLVSWFGNLLGINLGDVTSSIGSSSDVMSDLLDNADGVSGALDKATASAKKLKTVTLGIDELNINSPKDDSGSSSSGSGSGIGNGLLDKAFLESLEEYQKRWDEAYNNMENKAQEYADKVQNFFKPIVEYAGAVGNAFSSRYNEDNLDALGENLDEIKNKIVNLFNDSEVQDALDKYKKQSAETTGAVAAAGANLFTSYTAGATEGINNALGDLEDFNKTKLVSIVNNMTSLSEKVQKVADAFSKLSEIFRSDAFVKISETLTKIADFTIMQYIDNLTGVLSDLFGIATGPFVDNIDKVKSVMQNFMNIVSAVLQPLGKLIDLIAGNSEKYEDSIIHKALEGIESLLSLGLGAFLDGLNEKLETASTVITWVSNGVSLVIDAISKVTEAFGIMFDYFGLTWDKKKKEFREKIQIAKEWIEEKVIAKIENSFGTSISNIGKAFSNFFNGLKIGAATAFNGLISGIESLINSAISGINSFTEKINAAIGKAAQITHQDWSGIGSIPTVSLPRIEVKAYATGGFPEDGWFRASKGEYFGKFDDGTSVIANNNQIVDGISNGVRDANAEQNSLLREQNNLLRALLEKDTSINIGDKEIYKASLRGKNSYGSLIVT